MWQAVTDQCSHASQVMVANNAAYTSMHIRAGS
jgi:hypothetical protein